MLWIKACIQCGLSSQLHELVVSKFIDFYFARVRTLEFWLVMANLPLAWGTYCKAILLAFLVTKNLDWNHLLVEFGSTFHCCYFSSQNFWSLLLTSLPKFVSCSWIYVLLFSLLLFFPLIMGILAFLHRLLILCTHL